MQPLTFVHISDSHVFNDPTRRGWARGPSLPGAMALVREIEALPAPLDFVLHSGDVVHDPEREDEYRQALELYRRLSVRCTTCRATTTGAGGCNACCGESQIPAPTPTRNSRSAASFSCWTAALRTRAATWATGSSRRNSWPGWRIAARRGTVGRWWWRCITIPWSDVLWLDD